MDDSFVEVPRDTTPADGHMHLPQIPRKRLKIKDFISNVLDAQLSFNGQNYENQSPRIGHMNNNQGWRTCINDQREEIGSDGTRHIRIQSLIDRVVDNSPVLQSQLSDEGNLSEYTRHTHGLTADHVATMSPNQSLAIRLGETRIPPDNSTLHQREKRKATEQDEVTFLSETEKPQTSRIPKFGTENPHLPRIMSPYVQPEGYTTNNNQQHIGRYGPRSYTPRSEIPNRWPTWFASRQGYPGPPQYPRTAMQYHAQRPQMQGTNQQGQHNPRQGYVTSGHPHFQQQLLDYSMAKIQERARQKLAERNQAYLSELQRQPPPPNVTVTRVSIPNVQQNTEFPTANIAYLPHNVVDCEPLSLGTDAPLDLSVKKSKPCDVNINEDGVLDLSVRKAPVPLQTEEEQQNGKHNEIPSTASLNSPYFNQRRMLPSASFSSKYAPGNGQTNHSPSMTVPQSSYLNQREIQSPVLVPSYHEYNYRYPNQTPPFVHPKSKDFDQTRQHTPIDHSPAISPKETVQKTRPPVTPTQTITQKKKDRPHSGILVGFEHPSNILYLHCQLCPSSYGSLYTFKKHFRACHERYPAPEDIRVQTVKETKEHFALPRETPHTPVHLPRQIQSSSPSSLTSSPETISNMTTALKNKCNDVISHKSQLKPSNGAEIMYHCRFCGKQFALADASAFHYHVGGHRAVGLYECHRCKEVHKTDELLRSHIKKHKGSFSHFCNPCSLAFRSDSLLRAHICSRGVTDSNGNANVAQLATTQAYDDEPAGTRALSPNSDSICGPELYSEIVENGAYSGDHATKPSDAVTGTKELSGSIIERREEREHLVNNLHSKILATIDNAFHDEMEEYKRGTHNKNASPVLKQSVANNIQTEQGKVNRGIFTYEATESLAKEERGATCLYSSVIVKRKDCGPEGEEQYGGSRTDSKGTDEQLAIGVGSNVTKDQGGTGFDISQNDKQCDNQCDNHNKINQIVHKAAEFKGSYVEKTLDEVRKEHASSDEESTVKKTAWKKQHDFHCEGLTEMDRSSQNRQLLRETGESHKDDLRSTFKVREGHSGNTFENKHMEGGCDDKVMVDKNGECNQNDFGSEDVLNQNGEKHLAYASVSTDNEDTTNSSEGCETSDTPASLTDLNALGLVKDSSKVVTEDSESTEDTFDTYEAACPKLSVDIPSSDVPCISLQSPECASTATGNRRKVTVKGTFVPELLSRLELNCSSAINADARRSENLRSSKKSEGDHIVLAEQNAKYEREYLNYYRVTQSDFSEAYENPFGNFTETYKVPPSDLDNENTKCDGSWKDKNKNIEDNQFNNIESHSICKTTDRKNSFDREKKRKGLDVNKTYRFYGSNLNYSKFNIKPENTSPYTVSTKTLEGEDNFCTQKNEIDVPKGSCCFDGNNSSFRKYIESAYKSTKLSPAEKKRVKSETYEAHPCSNKQVLEKWNRSLSKRLNPSGAENVNNAAVFPLDQGSTEDEDNKDESAPTLIITNVTSLKLNVINNCQYKDGNLNQKSGDNLVTGELRIDNGMKESCANIDSPEPEFFQSSSLEECGSKPVFEAAIVRKAVTEELQTSEEIEITPTILDGKVESKQDSSGPEVASQGVDMEKGLKDEHQHIDVNLLEVNEKKIAVPRKWVTDVLQASEESQMAKPTIPDGLAEGQQASSVAEVASRDLGTKQDLQDEDELPHISVNLPVSNAKNTTDVTDVLQTSEETEMTRPTILGGLDESQKGSSDADFTSLDVATQQDVSYESQHDGVNLLELNEDKIGSKSLKQISSDKNNHLHEPVISDLKSTKETENGIVCEDLGGDTMVLSTNKSDEAIAPDSEKAVVGCTPKTTDQDPKPFEGWKVVEDETGGLVLDDDLGDFVIITDGVNEDGTINLKIEQRPTNSINPVQTGRGDGGKSRKRKSTGVKNVKKTNKYKLEMKRRRVGDTSKSWRSRPGSEGSSLITVIKPCTVLLERLFVS